ncbi:MAG: hypothetical protein SFY96_10290 [Planctomycetota bacterium]|nr:hypothetical protein [Planctomycetota bacterium]
MMPRKHSHTIADFYATAVFAFVSAVAFAMNFVAVAAEWESKDLWPLFTGATTAIVFAMIMVRGSPSTLVALVNTAVFLVPLAHWALIGVVAIGLVGWSLGSVLLVVEFFGGLLWAAAFVSHALNRNREQQTSSHCTNCGYDLRGISSKRCPECGTMNRPQRDPRS